MTRKEQIFEGVGVSDGVSIGIAHIRSVGLIDVPEYNLRKKDIIKEQNRLRHAVNSTKRQVRGLKTRASKLPEPASEELTFLLDAYLQMLDGSRLIRGAHRKINECLINAEAAIQLEVSTLSKTFKQMEDTYIAARIDDINEVGNRVLKNLGKNQTRPLSSIPKGSILVVDSLSPADMAQIDPTAVVGVATMVGGVDGHMAIMARALRLPCVSSAAYLMETVQNGDQIIIDGNTGQILLNPSQTTKNKYIKYRNTHILKQTRFSSLKSQQALSRDGTLVSLQANVELPVEMKTVLASGAEAIGLLRSEFMFMNTNTAPTEDAQYFALRKIVKKMRGKPVTIRSLDLHKETTPAIADVNRGDSIPDSLGLRGIRKSLMNPDTLEIQFKAMLRCSMEAPIRILLPMVSKVDEVVRAKKILTAAHQKLVKERVPVPKLLPPLGVMIEVPGAALAADAFAQVSDFFAIGSNDLTMYTLAADRSNENVAGLFDPLHPGVLRLIHLTINAAFRARIPISICGEIAGQPRYTALLIGLGLRELSMSPAKIPIVKQYIRRMDSTAASTRANLILEQADSGRILTLMDDFNAII